MRRRNSGCSWKFPPTGSPSTRKEDPTPVLLDDETFRMFIDLLHTVASRMARRLDIHGAKLDQLLQKVNSMSDNANNLQAQFQQEFDSFKADVEAQTSEIASVRVAFNGLNQQLAAALQAARDAGATQVQLAALQALHQTLLANTQGMVEAVATNTQSEGQTGTETPSTERA